MKQSSKDYRKNNLEYYKNYSKVYREKSENKDKRNKYLNEKYNNDINFKLTVILRNKLNTVLKNSSTCLSALKLLGCTVEELKIHLQKQFKPGMTWDNHSQDGWHIDHKIPCIKFDLSKPKEQSTCFHYSNLQPLWAEENLSKGRKTFNKGSYATAIKK